MESPFSVAAVTTWNRIPGDGFDHLQTMERTGRALADTGRTVLESWPDDRPPLRLLCFSVLGLTGSGAGRRMLNIMPTTPLDASVLAIDLTHPDARLQPLIDMCTEYSCYAATSAIERHPVLPDVLFHTGFVIGPDGLVLRTPKVWARSGPSITLIGSIRERYVEAFGEDAVVPVAITELGRIGCVVEGEIDADGAIDLLVERGVDIICHPTLRTGEHPGDSEDRRLADVATRTGTVVLSSCSAGEYVDDNVGGWAMQPFASGTSIWSAAGLVDRPANTSAGSLAWTTLKRPMPESAIV